MKNTLSVGFARGNITPEESVPLAGYGNNRQRMSQGALDPLCGICIAFSDGDNHTMILYTLDLIATPETYAPAVREAVSRKYGVAKEAVVLAATHTHSAPDVRDKEFPPIARYLQQLTQKLTQLAGEALADRKPATMVCGHSRTEGMNFVRHYILENGTCAGDNFGDFKSAPIRDHVTDADRQIQTVRILREGAKDILMVNWQAHPTKASTRATEYGWTRRPYISADYVGSCRAYLEEKTDYLVAYFQGACGNINSRSKIKEEDGTVDHVLHGQQLGDFVLTALENEQPLAMGRIKAASEMYYGQINHTEDHLVEQAQKIVDIFKETNDPFAATKAGEPYGIHSPYHAGAIIQKSKETGTIDMGIGAGCIGNLGFAFLPYEMFDTNGMQIKERSPFDMTFILECANGAFSYIPSQRGFEHGCYEADQCRNMPGTGEKIVDLVLHMMNGLKKETTEEVR